MTRVAQRWVAWLPTLIPALIGARYAWGVAGGPHLFDAGELAAAAWELSGSHPPGQVGHALVAHLLCLLPVGPIPARIALLSVACVVGAGILTGRSTRLLCEQLGMHSVAPWAAAASASMLMLSPPVGRQATRVEVYGLALLLTSWSLLELLRWALRRDHGALLRGALAAGLVASVHPPHALGAVAIGAALGLWERRDALVSPRTLTSAAAFALLGFLATVAYLPIRARAGAAMWGDPTDPQGLWAYLSAAAYQRNLVDEGSTYLSAVAGYARHATLSIGVLPVLAMLWMAARDTPPGRLGRTLGTAALLATCAVVLQPIKVDIPDYVAYLGPVMLLLSVGGTLALCRWLAPRPRPAAATLLLCASAPAAWLGQLDYLDADQPALETLGNAMLEAPPPRALVVSTTDFAGATWMMGQAIDGARPDVALLVSGLATSSWHWRQLGTHPAFDGRPRRGDGPNAAAAYVDGALGAAFPQVPIALEQPLHYPLEQARVAGPYALLAPAGQGRGAPPVVAENIAERLTTTVADDTRRTRSSDHDGAGAILRHYEMTRAERLLARKLTGAAVSSMLRACPDLPNNLRRSISPVSTPLQRPRPPTVRTPGAFLLTPGDAERALATQLWAMGNLQLAKQLMAWQSVRDPRAQLQLALFARLEGDRETEKRALSTFLILAPELSREAVETYAQEP